MRELIVGMDGFVGRHLCAKLPDAMKTTRRHSNLIEQDPRIFHLDLLKVPKVLPQTDVLYICAGMNGNLTCSLDPQGSYRVNVDGTINLAESFDYAFIVWISSTTVEWLTEHYGRQKRIVEQYLRPSFNVGIIRAGRILQSNIDELCNLMIRIGREKLRGIHLWNENEKPYEK